MCAMHHQNISLSDDMSIEAVKAIIHSRCDLKDCIRYQYIEEVRMSTVETYLLSKSTILWGATINRRTRTLQKVELDPFSCISLEIRGQNASLAFQPAEGTKFLLSPAVLNELDKALLVAELARVSTLTIASSKTDSFCLGAALALSSEEFQNSLSLL